ncbi:MAG: acyl-CoA reductase [Methylocystaceae bacterium]|nr:acyl-CoA reductase [Methylocystaceae bacterium]
MIPLMDDIQADMNVLVGDLATLSNRPAIAWEPMRLAFLADLSRSLLKHPLCKTMADVTTFAYWIRKANLQTLKDRFTSDAGMQVGVGVTFHICPSNVAVNFAYSLVFGLLAGNTCVLRLATKETPVDRLIVEAIRDVLSQAMYQDLKDAILLMRYERNEKLNAYWLGQADGRVIWGGDETVNHMRRYQTPPRSREITFADRYSFCALKPDAVLACSEEDLLKICQKLFYDIYLMDQAACSSPQLIVWVGEQDKIRAAKEKLWSLFYSFCQTQYEITPIQVMNKFSQICVNASEYDAIDQVVSHDNLLYRSQLNDVKNGLEHYRGYAGAVLEASLSHLSEMEKVVTQTYQTMTYFGFEQVELEDFMRTSRVRGIDRIVPIGQAVDMDIIWDGYEIISSLSRLVDIR